MALENRQSPDVFNLPGLPILIKKQSNGRSARSTGGHRIYRTHPPMELGYRWNLTFCHRYQRLSENSNSCCSTLSSDMDFMMLQDFPYQTGLFTGYTPYLRSAYLMSPTWHARPSTSSGAAATRILWKRGAWANPKIRMRVVQQNRSTGESLYFAINGRIHEDTI